MRTSLYALYGVAISLICCTTSFNVHADTSERIKGVAQFLIERANQNYLIIFERKLEKNKFLQKYFPNTHRLAAGGNLMELLTSRDLWEETIKSDTEIILYQAALEAMDKFCGKIIGNLIKPGGKTEPVQDPCTALEEGITDKYDSLVNRVEKELDELLAALNQNKDATKVKAAFNKLSEIIDTSNKNIRSLSDLPALPQSKNISAEALKQNIKEVLATLKRVIADQFKVKSQAELAKLKDKVRKEVTKAFTDKFWDERKAKLVEELKAQGIFDEDKLKAKINEKKNEIEEHVKQELKKARIKIETVIEKEFTVRTKTITVVIADIKKYILALRGNVEKIGKTDLKKTLQVSLLGVDDVDSSDTESESEKPKITLLEEINAAIHSVNGIYSAVYEIKDLLQGVKNSCSTADTRQLLEDSKVRKIIDNIDTQVMKITDFVQGIQRLVDIYNNRISITLKKKSDDKDGKKTHYVRLILDIELFIREVLLVFEPDKDTLNSGKYKAFRRYIIFFANLADADKAEDVAAILHSVVVPPASFALKREPESWHGLITAYFGATAGFETVNESYSDTNGFVGLNVPVGIEFSRGTRNQAAWSLMIAPLDFGYPVSLELNDKETDVEVEDIIAPGVYFTYGWKDIPVVMGVSYTVGRGIRTNFETEHHIGFFIGTDIPLFSLY